MQSWRTAPISFEDPCPKKSKVSYDLPMRVIFGSMSDVLKLVTLLDSSASRPLATRINERQERSEQTEITQSTSGRGRVRGLIKPRFKGFDDESDDDDVKSTSLHNGRHDSETENASILREYEGAQVSCRISIIGVPAKRLQSPTARAKSIMEDVEPAESDTSNVPTKKSRKRKVPEMEDENEEGLMDEILPAAAVMKRRKIEEQLEASRNGISAKPSSNSRQATPPKSNKTKKEVNIQEFVRERREAEEDAVRREEESLRESLDGMRVDDMKNLAVVEEMDLPNRPERQQRNLANGTSNGRWNDAWNSRKNFKKFRRRGDEAPARRGHSVMVPLEEVRKKDFGIGEEYWLEHDKSKKKRKGKDRVAQDTPSQPHTTARSEPDAGEEVPVPAELHIEEGDPDTVDISAPRLTRHAQQQQQASQDLRHIGDHTNTQSSVVPAVGNRGKRGAASQADTNATNVPPAKKPKLFVPLPEEDGSESDSEDELKFRFRKKR